ncbi:MAG: inositol monophosphatase family protein [Gammaproteobacteria bacterium]|nr:inositol monophosphatase family protein [Gammaproteobacteria bacterium]
MHPMLNIAVRAARRAATVIIRNFDRTDALEVELKGRRDYVSKVDREAEAVIIDTLRTAYPDHQILAEESGGSGNSEFVWIIDPLDGTTNFLHGYPQFAVSIALEIRGEIQHGLVYDPLRDELFTASRGGGAQLNNRRLRVSRCRSIDQSLLATGFPYRDDRLIEPYVKSFTTFMRRADGVRRAGAAALDLAYVAAGRLDGYWEFALKPWDIAAGMLLVLEAGGMVSAPYPEQDMMRTGNIVAATPKIFPGMLEILREHPVRHFDDAT